MIKELIHIIKETFKKEQKNNPYIKVIKKESKDITPTKLDDPKNGIKLSY